MKKSELTQAERDRHPSIHCTGSVKGMIKQGYWKRDDTIVRCGQYIYNLSINLSTFHTL